MHSSLQVFQLSTLAELGSLQLRWNELAAGMPMRTWEWLEGWWRTYGNAGPQTARLVGDDDARRGDRELYILVVFEAPDRLVGIAPWYIDHATLHGRVLRFLGSGEVCTDYSTVLCEPGYERAVAEEIANTLCDPLHLADWLTDGSVQHWDRIELDAVAADDEVMQHLFGELSRRNNLVHRRSAASCWRVNLPATWDEYLATLSKSHRKQVRRLDRELFATKRARLHEADCGDTFEAAWPRLERLHQSRQESLGKTGCFASGKHATFHRDVARQLLAAGMLRLQWLELDGREVAAEYHLVGQHGIYAYQGGIDPKSLHFGPGQLILLTSIKRAIEEGRSTFDFLRGDEPYKAHWRAKPHKIEDVRIIRSTAPNRLRRSVWAASDQLRNWLKTGLGRKTPQLTFTKNG